MAPRSTLLIQCLLVSALALTGCTPARRVLLPRATSIRVAPLDTLLAENPLASTQNIRATLLGQTEAMSYHLVQIRDRESPHVHATHDLTVTLLRGAGTLHVAGHAAELRAGDVAVVAHGTPHYFVNTGSAPAAAFVTFVPPYDGTDQVPAAAMGAR